MKGPIALLMTLILLANFLVVGAPVAGGAEADVSGEDLPDVPRYPGMVRMYYYASDLGKTIIYRGTADVSAVEDFYRTTMPTNGWSLVVEFDVENQFIVPTEFIEFLSYFERFFDEAPAAPPENYPEAVPDWVAGFQKGDARLMIGVSAAEGNTYVMLFYLPSAPSDTTPAPWDYEQSVPENVSLDLLLEFKSTGRLRIKVDYSGLSPLYSLYYLTVPVLPEVYSPVYSLQETSFAASSVLPGSDSILTAPAQSVGWEINIELTSPSEGTLTLTANGWMVLPLTEEYKQMVSAGIAAYKLTPEVYNQQLLQYINSSLTNAQYVLEMTNLSITELDWDGAASKLTFGLTLTAESSMFGAEVRRELPMSITTTGTGSIPATITEDLEGLTLNILFRLVSKTVMAELQMRSAGVTSTIGLDFEFELRTDEMGVVTRTDNMIVVDFGVLQEYWPTSLGTPSISAENEDVTFALRVPSGAEVVNLPSGYTQTDTTYTWTGSSAGDALLALVTGEAGTRISYWVGPATVTIENIQSSVGQTIEVENNYIESVEIESERVINVNFEKDQPVSKIRVTLAVAVESIDIRAQRLPEKPAGVVDPPAERGIVSHYLEVRTTAPEQVESATLEFRVSKLWISVNDIDKDTVRLLRFGEGEGRWAELPTNFIGEDNLYLRYSVPTTEFSYFAVVGQSVSPEREAALNIMLVVGILAMVVGALVMIFVVRSMRRSTKEISKSLKRLKAKS